MLKQIIIIFCLLVVTICGCDKSPPNACFRLLSPPSELYAHVPIGFDASCSAEAASYYWDFGNGQTITNNPTPQMTYDAPGTYPVALVVSNHGKSASLSVNVVIKP